MQRHTSVSRSADQQQVSNSFLHLQQQLLRDSHTDHGLSAALGSKDHSRPHQKQGCNTALHQHQRQYFATSVDSTSPGSPAKNLSSRQQLQQVKDGQEKSAAVWDRAGLQNRTAAATAAESATKLARTVHAGKQQPPIASWNCMQQGHPPQPQVCTL